MSQKAVIDNVPRDRWEKAQHWERNHWVNAQRSRARFFKNQLWRFLSILGVVSKYRGDDCNEWWKNHFDDYRFLPPHIENAFEGGCGPYTNVRLILERTQIKHLVLSDPLIRSYAKFKLTFVADMYEKVACVLDDHPLEDVPFASNTFDLTILINVLDHVQDAVKCMENLVRITKPGGIMIVGQELTNEQDLSKIESDPGRVGHPITVDEAWFEQFLEGKFSPIIRKVIPRHEGRGPEHHYGTLVFAGRKL